MKKQIRPALYAAAALLLCLTVLRCAAGLRPAAAVPQETQPASRTLLTEGELLYDGDALAGVDTGLTGETAAPDRTADTPDLPPQEAAEPSADQLEDLRDITDKGGGSGGQQPSRDTGDTGNAGGSAAPEQGDAWFTTSLVDGDRLTDPDCPFTIRHLKPEAEVLGLTNSLTQYASSSVNGTSPGGFIEHPGAMSDKAFARFKEDFTQNYAGAVNSGKWLFLEEGAKANMFSRDMEKAQVLESRKMQVTEIARIFGVPPHLVMDLEHATFSNIEQQSAEYVRDCINPLSVRLEQSMYRDLLTARERKIYYFKTNTNALLRGDTQTRAQYYNTMRQNGVMSTNDIRELEDMKPSSEPGADLLLVNGNMITLANAAANLPKGAQAKLKEGIR